MTETTSAKAHLTVDLGALTKNYQTLSGLTRASVAAVVKADAYGLGLETVSQSLWDAHCRIFFVAFTDEGLRLRSQLPDAEIYVFAPFLADDANALLDARLKPCLYSLEAARAFGVTVGKKGKPAQVALHVETGINRLGMSRLEVQAFLDSDARDALDVDLLMSHLACADQPQAEQNPKQLGEFEFFKNLMPAVPTSLANSGGIFLGSDYHMDLVRPGIALFGHDPHYHRIKKARVSPVAALVTRVGQLKTINAGESIGYGATVTCTRPTRIAVIMGGYADGLQRRLADPQAGKPYHVLINGKEAPMYGRLSMDLCTVDVSGFGDDEVKEGDRVEIFGSQRPIELMANRAGTIPYEILTHVGARVPRIYTR